MTKLGIRVLVQRTRTLLKARKANRLLHTCPALIVVRVALKKSIRVKFRLAGNSPTIKISHKASSNALPISQYPRVRAANSDCKNRATRSHTLLLSRAVLTPISHTKSRKSKSCKPTSQPPRCKQKETVSSFSYSSSNGHSNKHLNDRKMNNRVWFHQKRKRSRKSWDMLLYSSNDTRSKFRCKDDRAQWEKRRITSVVIADFSSTSSRKRLLHKRRVQRNEMIQLRYG